MRCLLPPGDLLSYELPSASLVLAKKVSVYTQGTHLCSRTVGLDPQASFISGAYTPSKREGCKEKALVLSRALSLGLTKLKPLHLLLRESMNLVLR